MIDLPETTNIYGRMPKELFYKHMTVYPELKKTFMDETQSITWRNKLSPETMPITPGKNIDEIAVVEIVLTRQAISQTLLELLARETEPYTVFIVRYEDWGQIWFCRREGRNQLQGQIRCDPYYQTSWLLYDDLELKLEGENLDQVYTNFLNHLPGAAPLVENPVIAEDTLVLDIQGIETENEATEDPETEARKPKEHLDIPELIEQLEATRKDLEIQIDQETQFSIQVKLIGELNQVKDKIQMLKTPRMVNVEINKPEIIDANRNNMERLRALFPNVNSKISAEQDKPM